jgi:hypothetical protein
MSTDSQWLWPDKLPAGELTILTATPGRLTLRLDRADVSEIHRLKIGKSNPSDECRLCSPFPCDDPDRHLGVPAAYTPLRNRGCRCGADFDGRDCMCFE